MIVSTNSTEKSSLPIYKTNITWSEIHTYSSLYLIELKASSSTDAVHEVRELVQKLVNVVNVKRVRAVAARFPNLHWIDFQIELPSGTELSDEAWNNVQDFVIDYEWKLRDVTKEKWYFHPQVVNRLSLLQDATKVIADSDAKQRAEAGIRTWSSPPLKFVCIKYMHSKFFEDSNMAFSSYTTIGEVLKAFQVTYTDSNFMSETEFDVSNYFREDLQTVMREGVVNNSEYAICENLIYPVLKEVWKRYSSKFTLWSHQSLTYDEKLSGYPEYILAKRSPLGKVVFDKPYFILVEAKQDNFEAGWAQCLAEMIAAQRLNEELPITIFGIVSNGDRWQFGKLEAEVFTKDNTPYTIYELDKLFAAVNYVFQQCELQLNNLVTV